MFKKILIANRGEIIEMRESKSRPNAGIVRIKCWGKKPDGTIVVEFERIAIFLKR